MAWILQAVVCMMAALAALILFRRQKERSLYDVHKLPGPEGIPVLGNALQVRDATRWHQVSLRPSDSLLGLAKDAALICSAPHAALCAMGEAVWQHYVLEAGLNSHGGPV